jgi:HlyD family secretion protein
MALASPGALRRSARRPSLWIGAALLAVAVATALVRSRGPVVPTALAARIDLEQHLVASGRVWVTTRIQLAAQMSGRIAAVHVTEGQRVRSGQSLLEVDDAEARAEVAQARAAVQQAAAGVEQVREVGAVVAGEAARRARTNLTRAESELARIRKLEAAGAVAPTDLEDAQRAADNARAELAAAQAQASAATPDGAESRVAVNALVESQARLAGAQARLDQTRVVARQDGVILARAVDPGDSVQPGDLLLEMAGGDETQLVIEPDERNLAWVQLGQKAHASADAYPREIFEAEVAYIAPSIDAQRGSVQVRLRVPDPPPFLKADMTVSVDLTVAKVDRVVTVPSDAIRGAATPAPWVFVVEDGRLARCDLRLGIRGEGHTEVASGLQEGEEVVLSSDRQLEAGQRVRPRRGDP